MTKNLIAYKCFPWHSTTHGTCWCILGMLNRKSNSIVSRGSLLSLTEQKKKGITDLWDILHGCGEIRNFSSRAKNWYFSTWHFSTLCTVSIWMGVRWYTTQYMYHLLVSLKWVFRIVCTTYWYLLKPLLRIKAHKYNSISKTRLKTVQCNIKNRIYISWQKCFQVFSNKLIWWSNLFQRFKDGAS